MVSAQSNTVCSDGFLKSQFLKSLGWVWISVSIKASSFPCKSDVFGSDGQQGQPEGITIGDEEVRSAKSLKRR